MWTQHAAAGHWDADYDENGLRDWAAGLRHQLSAPQVSLGLVFMAPRFFTYASQILDILRLHARIPLLIGCSGISLICDDHEIEKNAGIVLSLYYLPGANLTATHFTQDQIDAGSQSGFWADYTRVPPDQSNGWLAFADPFNMDSETWLREWDKAYPNVPVIGGLASGVFTEQRTQLYLNEQVYESGAVAVSIGGNVNLRSVISQGCTPIGDTWTITKVEHNLIHYIGNRPAYEVLMDTYQNLSVEEQQKTQGNLFIGLVINEYLEDFHRGDFLIRNLIGADVQSGILAVGALPRQGQTMQFQRRDALAATEDLKHVLSDSHAQLKGKTIYGGCLCCCNGRGERLFGAHNHDAREIQKQFGHLGLAGFFCNGEIGPVGQRNFLHGYTASLALFVEK